MNQKEINEVIRTGRRIQTPLVTIYEKPLSPAPARPFVAVVSKKIARRAVVRHRLQRWLRHLDRQLRPAGSPAAAVWIARPALAAARWPEIVASLEKYRATLGKQVNTPRPQ